MFSTLHSTIIILRSFMIPVVLDRFVRSPKYLYGGAYERLKIMTSHAAYHIHTYDTSCPCHVCVASKHRHRYPRQQKNLATPYSVLLMHYGTFLSRILQVSRLQVTSQCHNTTLRLTCITSPLIASVLFNYLKKS